MKKDKRDAIWALGHKLSQKEKNSPLASAWHLLAQSDEWYDKKLLEWGNALKKEEESIAAQKEILAEVQAALNWRHVNKNE